MAGNLAFLKGNGESNHMTEPRSLNHRPLREKRVTSNALLHDPNLINSAEALYGTAMVSCFLVCIFGPLRAEMALRCKPAHKVPCVIFAGLPLMGAMAL